MSENEYNYPNDYKEIIDRIETLEDKIGIIENSDENYKHSKNEPLDASLKIENQVSVIIKPKAYLKLATHALKYANASIPKEDWVEIIGLITGRIENVNTPLETITVYDYWPIGVGDAISVNILDADPVMEVYKNKKPDDFIVGWAHSHPSYTPFLSEDDIATQLRYQALWEESIAIVIDPEMITKGDQGYAIFRISSSRESYYELESEIQGMSPRASYEAISIIKDQLQSRDMDE